MYVEMRDICKNYGNFRASDHVSFGIEKGKLVALLGQLPEAERPHCFA